ncbi:hypothetical protein Prudu_606S000600 [Prunus dulcis]|uniref:Uncharacterized protein n=1 Tax=Prunus dulcis TaxID=3755 RepID=A0A5H2XP93_PRUDU|nr:hypothetical protein Prudu_588S000700 [Prunus dulcis]BBN68850.1 hypothetical protein Prudu_606S000600 [Prunus dulcis]
MDSSFSLCAKRAAAFQKLLAPPPSTNGHGTGGVGTAIESPTFSNRSPPLGRPEQAGKPCFSTEAPGARQNCRRSAQDPPPGHL